MSIGILQNDPLKHPAVAAWRELRLDLAKGTRLELLEDNSPQSTIYRLTSAGRADSAVIAKRSRQGKALIERTIYEEILPKLPLPMLRYYGFVEETNGGFTWLFLEDVSQEKYDRRVKQHRVAAARWLGIMNTAVTGSAKASRLPNRDPEHYLNLLRSACDTIQSSFTNPSLGADDKRLLNTVVAQCDYLSKHWNELAAACEGMPKTLVHGDFIRKNVGIRTTRKGITILPFDWENAGWGTPAEDLAKVDIYNYWLVVREQWSSLGIEHFKRLADAGKVFRCLVFLHWIAPKLANESVDHPMNDVKQCESWLEDLIREAGWRA